MKCRSIFLKKNLLAGTGHGQSRILLDRTSITSRGKLENAWRTEPSRRLVVSEISYRMWYDSWEKNRSRFTIQKYEVASEWFKTSVVEQVRSGGGLFHSSQRQLMHPLERYLGYGSGHTYVEQGICCGNWYWRDDSCPWSVLSKS